MIDESLPLSGSAFAMKRFKRYAGTVFWGMWGNYYDMQVFRAYHADNGRACALYAVNVDGQYLLTADSLDGIKAEVRRTVGKE